MKNRQSKKNPDLVIGCRKCYHRIYISTDILKKIGKILEDKESEGCPNCWEEPEENWVLLGFSNFERDYPNQ